MGEKGSLGRGKKGGKGNGGDKSPAWSSQDLGSTDCNISPCHTTLNHQSTLLKISALSSVQRSVFLIFSSQTTYLIQHTLPTRKLLSDKWVFYYANWIITELTQIATNGPDQVLDHSPVPTAIKSPIVYSIL